MNYSALHAEIALPAYADMSDTEIAAALNAETVQEIRDVPTSEARGLLLATGEWGALVLLARSQPSESVPAELIAAAITAEDTLRLTETIEVSDSVNWGAVQAMLGALTSAGVISVGTRDALLALRDTTTSRAAQIGLGLVRPGDIATARSTVA